MTRLLINAQAPSGHGIDRYAREIVSNLRAKTTETIDVLRHERDGRSRREELGGIFRLNQALLGNYEVVHSLYLGFPMVKRARRRVLTIHDVIFLDHPQHFSGLARRYMQQSFARQIAWATDIVFISEHARRRTSEHFDVRSTHTHVIHHGCTPRSAQPTSFTPRLLQLGLDHRPFLFYVGTFKPWKNVPRMLEAFSQLTREFPDARLVLAGNPAANDDRETVLALARKLGSSVIIAGPVTQQELDVLYRHALSLVFPSIVEGLGLPILEAQSAGTNCITSRDSAMSEVAPHNALLVDPLSSEEIAQAMRTVLKQPKKRPEIKYSMQWPEVIDRYRSVYGI